VLAVLLSAGGANAASVSVGRDHACAVLNDGKLMCWGSNLGGQLGIGVTGGDSPYTGRAGEPRIRAHGKGGFVRRRKDLRDPRRRHPQVLG
jgi:alpha-tubulin suppressor-like RCC1 family protein